MNLIAKKIHWIGILLLVGFSAAAAALYFDLPAKAPRPKPAVVSGQFVCPMHSDVVSDKAAKCSKCGMALVAAAELSKSAAAHEGCGSTESSEAHGCCSSPNVATAMTLPPGHPPIEGYTVQPGCDHSSNSATSASK